MNLKAMIKPVVMVNLLGSSLVITPLMAQDETELALEEVVVTAQKREQSLQDIASAVSAIPAAEIRDFLNAGENIRALGGRVPSLQVESSNGRQSPRFYIRGLGNFDFDVNATQPVSFIFDEVALENSVLKSIPVFDIERVEVLQGPQGTLFGRGTPAGVVKVDSVKPGQETDGYISGSFGSRDTFSLEGALGGAVSENTSLRGSFKFLDRGEWIDNTLNGPGDDFGGFDEFAYRLQLSTNFTERLSALFKIHGFHQDGDQPQIFFGNAIEQGSSGLRPGFDEEIASQDAQSGFELDHFGVNAKFEFQLNDNIKITSISAFDTVDSFSQADIDGGIQGGPEAIGQLGQQAFFSVSSGDGLSDHEQISQEYRLSGEANDGDIFYQVGFYFFDESITVDSFNFDNAGAPTSLDQVVQDTRSIAVFGQAEFQVNDRFSVVAGLRFTDDDKELDTVPGAGSSAFADTIEADDSYVSWELSGNYQFSDNVSGYARLATASRGPVTIGRFGFTDQADTEDITSFEVGVKADLFGGRARWNSAAYVYQLDDHQLTATGGVANTNELFNADRVDGIGLETSFEMRVTEHFRFSANLSYNNTEIDDPDLNTQTCGSTPSCTVLDPIVATIDTPFGPSDLASIDGNPLPRAPELLANFSLKYDYPLSVGSLYAHTDWNYRDESNIFLYESVEFVAESRLIGGVRLGYRNSNTEFDVAIVGRNITDQVVVDGALDFLNLTAFINEPRYWGIEVRKGF